MSGWRTSIHERFAMIPCYLLAGGANNQSFDFERRGDITRLEQSYRRYASLFENVRLVLKSEQARGWYLNYPYITDQRTTQGAMVGIESALAASPHEFIFLGSTRFDSFPLNLAAHLVKSYNGESFLGYGDPLSNPNWQQPLFGLYHKRLAERISKSLERGEKDIRSIIGNEGTMLPLPKEAALELGLV